MKRVKFLFVAVFLTCIVGVNQTMAQAYIERGTDHKPLIYVVDGETYFAWADLEYQYEGANHNFNWVAHGTIVEAYKYDTGEFVGDIPLPKKTIEAYDPRGYDERVTINPDGKVTVIAHVKVAEPWW